MAIAVMWICIGVMNIVTSILNKYTHEHEGKTTYWDGLLCGLNITLILAWVCRICGLI